MISTAGLTLLTYLCLARSSIWAAEPEAGCKNSMMCISIWWIFRVWKPAKPILKQVWFLVCSHALQMGVYEPFRIAFATPDLPLKLGHPDKLQGAGPVGRPSVLQQTAGTTLAGQVAGTCHRVKYSIVYHNLENIPRFPIKLPSQVVR